MRLDGRAMAVMASAISSGASTWSTVPVASALSGMPLNWAVSGLSQNTTPPARLTSWMPRDPSLPVPERTTAMARSPASCASDRKK